MDSLVKLLLDKGFNVTPVMNGEYLRFDRGGKTLNGWFRGWEIKDSHDQVLAAEASFGDWVTGEKHHWAGGQDTANFSPEKIAEIAGLRAAALEAEKLEKLERQGRAAVDARRLYRDSTRNGVADHPYIVRKKIDPGTVGRLLGDKFIIPVLVGPRGSLEYSSLQLIAEDGSKKFLTGGRLDRAWSLYTPSTNPAEDFSVLHIAEGYATAASIGMALHCSVLVAFNTSNMVKLCRDLKGSTGLTPDRVVICADNDGATKGNPGMVAAREARDALIKQGIECRIVAPPAGSGESADFNDLHCALGLEAVRVAITGNEENTEMPANTPTQALTKEPVVEVKPALESKPAQGPAWERELLRIPLTPIQWRTVPGKKGLQSPTPDQVARGLDDAYGDLLLRYKKDIFLRTKTHWMELDEEDFTRFIRGRAQLLMSNLAGDKQLDGYVNLLIDKIPSTSRNMYLQQPNLANFLDGTLEILQEKGKYSLHFREHRREDLLTWVLPYEYKAPRPANLIFSDWLNRSFENDPDKDGKIRALKQLAGACLVSLFPRTAFLYGVAGSGKSTFAKLCSAFVGPENRAGVQPGDMKPSNGMMQTLINKQVNIVTDISEEKINSVIFKQIEDRVEFHINRKYKAAVMAHIPALHMFCGNKLPRGIDGASDAMDRRISIVEFLQVVKEIETGEHTREFEQVILSGGPGAVLDFMEEGLRDLCATGGIYFNPRTGVEHLKMWKRNNDPVARFFEAIAEGEFPSINLHRDASIRCGGLWVAFQKYLQDSRIWSDIGRNSFYDAVVKLGYPRKEDRHAVLHFHGVGVCGREDAGNPGNTGSQNAERF